MLLVLLVIGVLILAFLGVSWIKSVKKSKNFFKEYGLSVILFGLFATSWIAQGISEWGVYKAEAESHNEPAEVQDYLMEFSQSTFENWQSEFLQLFVGVTLTTLYIHKNSADSRDSDDELLELVKEMKKKLDSL